MKIVLTGSLGHIGKPLTKSLIDKGHLVTVISSNNKRQRDIENLGAIAAIGSMEDVSFLSETFRGAHIVYLMEPPVNFFDQKVNMEKYWTKIANNYREALEQSGVTKVIHLSSIGGHTYKDVGMLGAHHLVEDILKKLPSHIAIKTMRPVGFYYNMLAFIPSIKKAHTIFQNYGGDEKEPWVSPLDIAGVINEEVEKPFNGRAVRYIASDEVSPNEIAKILGKAIDKPDLKWTTISDEEMLTSLRSIGMNPEIAKGLVEMNVSRVNGILYEDYLLNKPVLGNIKITDFAKEFSKAFNNS